MVGDLVLFSLYDFGMYFDLFFSVDLMVCGFVFIAGYMVFFLLVFILVVNLFVFIVFMFLIIVVLLFSSWRILCNMGVI